MTIQAQPGEQLVGAYHQLITGCDLISYNQRSREQGNQMELDVLAIHSEGNHQTVYACEVITHIDGMLYTTSSDSLETDRWEAFGNIDYQHTLERIWKKFEADCSYVTDVFDSADAYVFQLWSPVVPEGHRTAGLEELQPQLEAELRPRIDGECIVEAIYNKEYTNRIDSLRQRATSDAGGSGNIGFRFLQILEHLRR